MTNKLGYNAASVYVKERALSECREKLTCWRVMFGSQRIYEKDGNELHEAEVLNFYS